MRIVTLPGLKVARYQDDPKINLRRLQAWAREGRLPGAFKTTENADWLVDLEQHDAAIKLAQIKALPAQSKDERLEAMVIRNLRQV